MNTYIHEYVFRVILYLLSCVFNMKSGRVSDTRVGSGLYKGRTPALECPFPLSG
jgi:hypothetical protein